MSIESIVMREQIKTPSPVEHILFPRDPTHDNAGLLARFLTDLSYEKIPSDVLHLAKLVTLDTIGCIVAATATPLGEKILAAYGTGIQSNGCCVPGTSVQLAPSIAAKVNGWLSDVLDYEDTASGHPSATVIPAALAVAQHLEAPPKQFLTGIVAGYEAGLRLHDATRASPEAYRRFASYHAWHGVAAGAAAMVVSGGSEEQFRSALGHAAANTNIPLWYVEYGRPAHALKANYGQMALGGVDAALCARRNIIGPFALLSDPKRGFAAIIGSDQFDPTQLSDKLNEIWRMRETCFKGYPACYALHSTIHAVSTLIGTNNIEPGQIDRILVGCSRKVSEWFSYSDSLSDLDGQFSVEYVSAMAALSIQPGREWYSPAIRTSSRVADLMSKIDVEVDPGAEKAYWTSHSLESSVSIFTKAAQSFSITVDCPPGHYTKPFRDSDIEDKFLRNVRATSLEERGPQIIEKLMNVDRLSSLGEISELLRVPAA
ncbi:MmgE/PrpD family protein [Mesorhizobium sp. B4-1-4]|uniref:MmgE/PrpD family protein n=1 Tax=Mesorhizobium sp. B4-1-4 TaxID=2589888 RepID=UPI00112BB520|nr:MmgE/PrpD family protein [Mesorhizobium sp. B4-1-4]UCI32015.1 MmgE/PrpD family protein [Mesorhizobium sp. B4-1-4]